ncbi:MAG: bifunctional nuclease family protein [Bacteroidia bacterium]|nr:bifunctional nuclease family protein [Bacteroidia bacterium]MCZ2248655.1 DUF151 domain-containing protein [Bacteroidia bacterium]
MKKIKLEILALSYSQTQSGAYALVLAETDGNRRLPIIIGAYEAQAIAIELEKMIPSRPLTHDLLKAFAEGFDIVITEVIIYKIVEGVFYSKLVANNIQQTAEIDARTSDAIALALRFNCPIYTYESILSTYGVVLDEKSNKLKGGEDESQGTETKTKRKALSDKGSNLADINEEELKKMLQEAIDNEDYEKASHIRDELNNRNKNE